MDQQPVTSPGSLPENQNVQGVIYEVVNAEVLISILKQKK